MGRDISIVDPRGSNGSNGDGLLIYFLFWSVPESEKSDYDNEPVGGAVVVWLQASLGA